MPKKPSKNGAEFLEKKFPDLSYAVICEECGFNQNTFRTWVLRNNIPKEAGEKLAKFLKISSADLFVYFQVSKHHRRKNRYREPVIPGKNIANLISLIAQAKCPSLTFDDIRYAATIPGIETLTPESIKKLIAARYY